MSLTKLHWKIWPGRFGDRVNRAGMPEQEFMDRFKEIDDLDFICEEAGGQKGATLRLRMAPMCHGQYDNHAETIFVFNDAGILVHNKANGYHTMPQIAIYAEDEQPVHGVIDRFAAYCQKPPTISVVDDHEGLQQLEVALATEIARHQARYDDNSITHALAVLTMVFEHQERRMAAYGTEPLRL